MKSISTLFTLIAAASVAFVRALPMSGRAESVLFSIELASQFQERLSLQREVEPFRGQPRPPHVAKRLSNYRERTK